MSSGLIPCPTCKQTGKITRHYVGQGFSDTMNCQDCSGYGMLDEGFPERKRLGDEFKLWRVSHDLSLREAAKQIGLKAYILSAYENARPTNEWTINKVRKTLSGAE